MSRIRPLWPFADSRKRQFIELVEPHLQSMYRMAYRWTLSREEAEDLVQDVLLKLTGRLEQMREIEKLRPWLIKVLYRHYVDLYRRRARSPISASDDDHTAAAADPHDAIDRLEWQQTLLKGLALLNDEQRDTILLHDVEGYALLEIAEITAVSVGTVKSRLHRGRRELRKFLEQGTTPVLRAC